MSFINQRDKEVHFKIAYYGALHAGKSSSLHALYTKTAPDRRGNIVTLSEPGDESLVFEFLPLSIGKVGGHTVRFHLYTVPGQHLYDASRTLILKGVDGIVFVADSRIGKMDENIESWKALRTNLRNHGMDLEATPVFLQANKRDLPNVLPAASIKQLLKAPGLMSFETVATKGKNIPECFQAMAKQVLKNFKN